MPPTNTLFTFCNLQPFWRVITIGSSSTGSVVSFTKSQSSATTMITASGIIAYPPKSWKTFTQYSPLSTVKANAVIVNRTVLQSNATGRLDSRIMNFTHHDRLTNITTKALITQKAVTILKPLHGNERTASYSTPIRYCFSEDGSEEGVGVGTHRQGQGECRPPLPADAVPPSVQGVEAAWAVARRERLPPA